MESSEQGKEDTFEGKKIILEKILDIKKHGQWLNNFYEIGPQSLNKIGYPIKTLTSFYAKISKKLEDRIQKSVFLSDIFYMQCPDMLIGVVQIEKYLKDTNMIASKDTLTKISL